MADIVSPAKRSEMMAGIAAKNTKPEMKVRQMLHELGFRFRLHRRDLPGKPDIVLPKWKTVIFVHGCFWHGHEDCPIFRLPKSRTEFWDTKIDGNKKRDERAREELLSLGWRVVEVWECAMKGRTKMSTFQLAQALENSVCSAENTTVEIRGTQIA